MVNMGQYPIAEYPYEDVSPKHVVDVGPGDLSIELKNLKSFAMYRIEVTGFTIKGEGPVGVVFAGKIPV